MVSFADKPILFFTTNDEFRDFLEADPPDGGVRLQLRKKTSSAPGITWQDAVDVALCYGWIDGQAGRFDDDYTLQAFTPRRKNSPWSLINQGHVERLIAEGRMRPGGLAEVERAKADGRWDAAYRQKDHAAPPDLQSALDASPAAAAKWATLTKQNSFAIVFRIQGVKRPETRARKIGEFVAMLERGETIYPQKDSRQQDTS
ncbi:MAG TPA: YdeI/OmpD-associated family protein [Pseudolysinimonas sp.]